MHYFKGFTLVELMVVVVMIAILSAIALPSYQSYLRKNLTAQVQQEMLKLADQLERHKAKNFSYRKFDPQYLYTGATTPMSDVYVPDGIDLGKSKYKIELRDTSTSNVAKLTTSELGSRWAIKATPINTKDSRLYTLLLTSTGVHCKTLTAANVSYQNCIGTGVESW